MDLSISQWPCCAAGMALEEQLHVIGIKTPLQVIYMIRAEMKLPTVM